MNFKENMCFICEVMDDRENLRQVEVMKTCETMREEAAAIKDTKLIAKLAGPDAIAQELKYHLNCRSELKNKARSVAAKQCRECKGHGNKDSNAYPMAFSELVTYLHESKLNNENVVTHKLADLEKLYTARLLELGIVEPNINVTRLKANILHHLPEMKAYKKGREVMLAFEKDVGPALAQADEYHDALVLAEATQIL